MLKSVPRLKLNGKGKIMLTRAVSNTNFYLKEEVEAKKTHVGVATS